MEHTTEVSEKKSPIHIRLPESCIPTSRCLNIKERLRLQKKEHTTVRQTALRCVLFAYLISRSSSFIEFITAISHEDLRPSDIAVTFFHSNEPEPHSRRAQLKSSKRIFKSRYLPFSGAKASRFERCG